MANEVTTSTFDDLTHTSLVQPVVVAALSEQPGFYKFAREFNILDQPTAGAKIPTETSWWGSANDDGAGVDTEFDGTQATDLSNTAASTGSVTCTPGEYGVAMEITDNVSEDSVRGIDVYNWLEGRHLHAITLAMTDDFLALLASLSNSVGSTGVDLTIAQLISAQQGLRVRGAVSDTTVYILDNQQVSDIESALIATNAAAAIYALSADRLIGYAPTMNNGMDASRQVMSFRGMPVFATGLTDTANAAADVVGACFCVSTAANDASGSTTFGQAWKRLPRLETDRIVLGRSTQLVTTARWGCVELQDGSGTAIITDA